MEKILGMEQPFHYRNKAQFPVGKSKDGRIITGFYAGRTPVSYTHLDVYKRQESGSGEKSGIPLKPARHRLQFLFRNILW